MGIVSKAAPEITQNASLHHRHLFSVEEYYQLGAAGILNEDSRVELIEGELIDMPPIGSQHAHWVDRLARFFIQHTRDEVTVRVQNPVRLGGHSEPEPDLALLRPREPSYAQAHPNPEDVLLLIEVADSSLDYDRDCKVPLYARHGIAEVWLFDLVDNQLEIYLEPSEEGYRKMLRPRRDERVSPVLLPTVVMDLGDLYSASRSPD